MSEKRHTWRSSSNDLIDLHTPLITTPFTPAGNANRSSYFANSGSSTTIPQQPVVTNQNSLGTASGPGHTDVEDQNDGRPDRIRTPSRYSLPPIEDADSGSIRRAMSDYIEEPVTVQPRRSTETRIIDLEDEEDELDSETASFYDFEDENVHMARPMSLTAMQATPLVNNIPSLSDAHSASSGRSTPMTVSRPATPSDLLRPRMPARIFSGSSDVQECLRCTCARCARFNPQSDLCVDEVVKGKTDFNLQKVDPFFTDPNGNYYRAFQEKLKNLSAANSETTTCIEEYLIDSEREWFNTFRNAKLGILKSEYSARSSVRSLPTSYMDTSEGDNQSMRESIVSDEFLLGTNYRPPHGLRKWLQIRIGDWPIYSFFLALGQIMAANSYQIVLLTGAIGETSTKLYIIASIYLLASAGWWWCFRRFPSVVALSSPFFIYGLAFLSIGVGPFVSYTVKFWVQNLGVGFYALASASGSLMFATNFGDEGGSKVKTWVFRACIIQGSQQMYIAALWYWGSGLTRNTAEGINNATSNSILGTWKITAIAIPITALLWAIGFVLWVGLPKYYRQAPGKMPSFYRSAMKRKIIKWFFVMALVQNFFMSAPYGRNWAFLYSSTHAKPWQVLCMAILFFIGVWAGLLTALAHLTKKHSWILPLFAIGLGAPRFAQIWWGTSGIGLYLPWAGSYVAGALVSRALWLWLGVLDAIQGVGFGMMMLSTLTRMHVAFAVMATQMVGTLATILARAAAPNRIGPGPISPDISGGISAIWEAWFWVALVANLLLCLGFYKFYRKEQLQKP